MTEETQAILSIARLGLLILPWIWLLARVEWDKWRRSNDIHEGGGWDLNGDHDGCLMLAWIAGVMAIGIVLALMFAAMT